MGDEFDTGEIPSPVGKTDPPALRLHHFLIWIAIAAALLTVQRLLITSYSESEYVRLPTSTMQLANALSSIFLSGEWMIVWLVIVWRLRGVIRHVEPGELLAAHGGLSSTLVIASSWHSLIIGHVSVDGPIWYAWLLWPETYVGIAWMILFGWLNWWSSEIRPWRVAYGVLALWEAGSLLQTSVLFATSFAWQADAIIGFSDWAYWIKQLTLLLVILLASYRDRVLRTERRWTHWFGMALWIATFALTHISDMVFRHT